MRILFTCAAGESHFYNTAPLALAARDLGHEVAFATAVELTEFVEKAGFPLLPAGAGRLRLRAEASRAAPEPASGPSEWAAGARLFGRIAPRLKVPSLLDVIREFRPDAVVSEFLDVAGPVAAAHASVPCFTLSIGPFYADTLSDLFHHASQGFGPAFPGPAGAQDLIGGGYIDVCPPELQTAEGSALPNRLMAGLRTYHGEGTREQLPVSRPAPRVVMTFGTVSNRSITDLYESAARLGEAGLDVIVTLGPRGWFGAADPAEGAQTATNSLGPRVRVVDFSPLDRELAMAAAVIHHGGSNTMRAAIEAAVPSLVVPQDGEQARNARWIEKQGLGRMMRPSAVDAESVRRAVADIIEDSAVRGNLSEAQAALRAMPGPDAVVAEIERRCTGAAARTGGARR